MTSSRTEHPTVRLVGGGRVPLGERAQSRREPTTPFLTLSLGPVVGFALRWDRDHVKSGSTRFDGHADDTAGERCVRFQSYVRELLDTVEPGLVAYQRPHEVRRRETFFVELGQEALLLPELEDRTNYVAVARADLAQDVLRLRVARGSQWVRAASARWGRKVNHLKEAEALCLLAWALDAVDKELLP